MFGSEKKEAFTVIIDEVENHLHPTMQRRILSDFLNAFPLANFIVSTHSPLIVNSVRESAVYIFRFNERNKVISLRLDLTKNAKTAADILDDVLGVSFTMPVWAEDNLKEIITKYSSGGMDDNKFNMMRSELAEIGLEDLMPRAIIGVLGENGCAN